MSNEVRILLRSAADSPVGEPDVSGAWQRGRRLRARRRVTGAIGAGVLIVVASIGGAAVISTKGAERTVPGVRGSQACGLPVSGAGGVPPWTSTAHPPTDVPHLVSRERNVAGFIFGNPLQAGRHPAHVNKILWVVRAPRNGHPLRITARRLDSKGPTARYSLPAGSEPGEIYPSVIDVAAPGCWSLRLTWGTNHASITLRYQ